MKRYDNNLDGILEESDDGSFIYYADHLAAIQQLTDLLAQAEKERDELKRGKSCVGCDDEYISRQKDPCYYYTNAPRANYFKPRDPSAAHGGGK